MFAIIKQEKHMEKSDSSLLSRKSQYANRKQWNQFLSIFLLAAGIGFTVAGIVFFFAYNWDELPKFAKLGLIEALLVCSVLLAVFSRWNTFIKQILLTGATFLTGTLFAVYGQTYQTGADAYDLFLGWTIFTLLWAVSIRFAPLWLTFVVLLCTTIWLYTVQIVPDSMWKVTLLTNAITWICAIITIIAERMKLTRNLEKQNHWFISTLSLATIVYASYILIIAICDNRSLLPVPLISTLIIFLTGLWFGWKQRNLFYLAAIPFATLMILLSAFICHTNLRASNLFLSAGIIVIIGTTLLIYSILHLKKQWYDTEE